MERWRDVPGFEGAYEVSDQGRVRSLDREIVTPCRWGGRVTKRLKGRILKPGVNEGGHLVVHLGKAHQDFVHRLVLAAFVRPRRQGEECRHLDGNPTNNVVSNLAWGTRFENIADRSRLGEHNPPYGTRNHRAVLNETKVQYIRRESRHGRSYSAIGRDLSVSPNVVRSAAIRRTWGWLA